MVKVLESVTTTNPTNLAAAGVEQIFAGTQRVDYYNELIVINGGNVKIRIRYGNDTADILDIEAKTASGFTYDTGKRFTQIVQVNQDAATAEVAGTIIFTVARKEVE